MCNEKRDEMDFFKSPDCDPHHRKAGGEGGGGGACPHIPGMLLLDQFSADRAHGGLQSTGSRCDMNVTTRLVWVLFRATQHTQQRATCDTYTEFSVMV
jgi:hypothetical protein